MDFDALRKAQGPDGPRPGQPGARPGQPAIPGFTSALDRALQQAAPTGWESHLARIETASLRLREQPHQTALADYRLAVKDFLQEFLEQSHKRRKVANFDPQAEHDHVLLVRNIDARLEELSRQFLQQEGDQLAWLALLDEIRGLLVDLAA